MSIVLSNDLSVARIDKDSMNNRVRIQDESVVEFKMMDGGWYEDPMGGGAMEPEKPSIFANTIFLIVLTVLVLVAGVGSGFLFAKKKIKKGLDYDENY